MLFVQRVLVWGHVAALSGCLGSMGGSQTWADVSRWTHFYVANPLPGESWGAGGPALADFDGDGDLDLMTSRRTTSTAYWYERVNDATWVRHTMGRADGLKSALGACALDIDQDGWPDVATWQVWFENPGNLASDPDGVWPAHQYAGSRHDILAGDINGDGWDDVITNNGATWFATPGMKLVRTGGDGDYHGGPAPRGVGDLDGDGDNDIVQPGRWLENPGRPIGTWRQHPWPHEPIPGATYGVSTRAWVADINRDGRNDIIYSDCDTGYSHVYWVENQDNGRSWVRHPLSDPPTAPGDVPGTGSFHSLAVADFDLDGDLDIYAGEQEDPDQRDPPTKPMKPAGLKERQVIWENRGSDASGPRFEPVVFHVDNPGAHESKIGDVDGDGDLDIVSKIWNADGGTVTANYWRNDND